MSTKELLRAPFFTFVHGSDLVAAPAGRSPASPSPDDAGFAIRRFRRLAVPEYCPARLGLGSLASAAPGQRETRVVLS